MADVMGLVIYIILLVVLLRMDWYFTRKVHKPKEPPARSDPDQFTLQADQFLKMFPKTNFKE